MQHYFQQLTLQKIMPLVIIGASLIATVILVQGKVFTESDAAVGKPDLYFSSSNVTVDKNSLNTLDVYMRTNNASVSGITLMLSYDPLYINQVTVEPVSPFVDLCSLSTHCSFPAEIGKLTLNVGTGLNPVNGEIKVATISYTATDEAGQTSLFLSNGTTVAVVDIQSNSLGSLGNVTVCIDSCEATPTPRNGGQGDRNTPTPTDRERAPRPTRTPRTR